MELFCFYFSLIAHSACLIICPVVIFSGTLKNIEKQDKPTSANRLYFEFMLGLWAGVVTWFILKLAEFSTVGYTFAVLGIGSLASSLLATAFTGKERRASLPTVLFNFIFSCVQVVLLIIIGFKYVW